MSYTSFIHIEMLAASQVAQSMRKTRTLSGAQAERIVAGTAVTSFLTGKAVESGGSDGAAWLAGVGGGMGIAW